MNPECYPCSRFTLLPIFPVAQKQIQREAPMKDVTDKNFGVIIAFLLPGFLLLWGLSFSSDAFASWLATSGGASAPTVGGFLYATLASLALGLLISAARWLVIDHLHHFTGVSDPGLNFANLKDKDRYAAFVGVVENHYRYYQYYANTLVAIVAAFVVYLVVGKEKSSATIWLSTIATALTLFFGSRDALKKYRSSPESVQQPGFMRGW